MNDVACVTFAPPPLCHFRVEVLQVGHSSTKSNWLKTPREPHRRNLQAGPLVSDPACGLMLGTGMDWARVALYGPNTVGRGSLTLLCTLAAQEQNMLKLCFLIQYS